MNGEPLLIKVAEVLTDARLEAVMVGNAAAALRGAPVTTLDIDFMFRKTPLNLKKLKAVAKCFEAIIMRPYYPVSELYRVVNDEQGLQLDFMAKLNGIRSFWIGPDAPTDVAITRWFLQAHPVNVRTRWETLRRSLRGAGFPVEGIAPLFW